MRLLVLTFVAFIGCCATATAAPAGSTGPAQSLLPKVDEKSAAVRVVRCVSSGPASGRRATFRAVMAAVAESHVMQVRFRLVESDGSSRRIVKARGLGVWRKSRPGVPRFAYRQRLLALEPGYAYRVIVHYRWYDVDGELIAAARRRSGVCGQGRKLPNLFLDEISVVGPGPTDDTFRYRVTVSNRGRASATGVEVALFVDGSELDRTSIGGLSPGTSGRTWFVGPACAKSVGSYVDPDALIQETNEADNSISSPCPAAGSSR